MEPPRVLEFLDHVAASRERHRRRVAGLLRDVEEGRPLREKQEDKGMPEVVRPRLEADCAGRGLSRIPQTDAEKYRLQPARS